MNRTLSLRLAALAALAVLVPACSDSDDDAAPAAVVAYTQVERLARPAIGEGLFTTNDFLNAFNSIPPTSDLAALGPSTPGSIGAEARATLDAVDLLDTVDDLTSADAIGAFVPDVMRINTAIASGYGAALNAFGSPVGGRRITDDVIDITLSYLVTGNPAAGVSDGVSFGGVAGNEAQPGHTAPSMTFPFLAAPK